MADDEQLDQTDAAIVTQLYESPRMAFREIARRLDISEATVRTRVRRLQDAQILQFTAFVDPAGFGHGVLCVALVDVAAAQHDTVVKILQEWHEVVYLSTLFGHHSLQLQLSGDSEYHLWELIRNMRAIDGVLDVHAQIEAKVHKIRYIPHTGPARRSPQ
jgi:Lrp/AsnC family transcriptional regulator, regulator for asnA, asnC and gidA